MSTGLCQTAQCPELIKHNGAHILHDIQLCDVTDACGLCLSTTNGCVVHLLTKGKTITISWEKSKCVNLCQFKLKQAATFTPRSPCTNNPLRCILCPNNAPAVWKYNLRSHIAIDHPRAKVELYENAYRISEQEMTLLKAVYLTKPRASKKKKAQGGLLISEGHSTRMAIW